MSNGQINLIIDGLVVHLFQREDKRIEVTTLGFVKQNEELTKGNGGFFYAGDTYGTVTRASPAIPVHESLHTALDAFSKDRKQVVWDKLRIKQALQIALREARTLQDVRDSLPNGIAEFIDQIKDMPRTRKEGFLLIGNPRQHAQYFKLREKMEFYLAVRLLY